MALKLLRRNDQPRILRQFCVKEDDLWKVKEYVAASTEIGKQSFASRVQRLWPLIPEEIKVMKVKTRNQKEKIKEFVRSLDSNFILWGEQNEEEEIDESDQQQCEGEAALHVEPAEAEEPQGEREHGRVVQQGGEHHQEAVSHSEPAGPVGGGREQGQG